MRLLHTADWHIGKRLHQYELKEDFDHFMDVLVEVVKEQQIDAVLVSGDVFDLANPSAAARQQYYRALVRLNALQCPVILTGGNHDSPAMLNAPRAILSALQIHVIGQLPTAPEEVLIPLGEGPEVVVAAIPFLRDADLVQFVSQETFEERQEAVRAGIRHIFASVAALANEKYPGIPLVGMGHLFTAGATSSESEREIQVGNLGAFPVEHFPDDYDYIALGHIHRPQQPGEKIWYSGSPYPLSFSEYVDKKRVVVYDTATGEATSVSLPAMRQLVRIQGPLGTIREQLGQLDVPGGQLPTLIEVTMEEERYDPQLRLSLEHLVSTFKHPQAHIVKYRLHFTQQVSGAEELFDVQRQTIKELEPREVFRQLLDREAPEDRELLEAAYDELLQEIWQSTT